MLKERDELVVVDGEPIWWDEDLVREIDRQEHRKKDERVWDFSGMMRKNLPTLISVVVLVAWSAAVWGVASWHSRVKTEERMAAVYAQELQDYKDEQERLAEVAAAENPYTKQLNAEAESLARVLYGVKDNDESDLKTYCWCVFNRVDNNSYPSTLEDVIAQPGQWMRYDETNPILEDLYQIAREQLDEWHLNSHRPCSSDYVFMNWSATDICLRDNFYEGSGTHYWRWGQK